MALIDFNREPLPDAKAFDYVIIGAGAAGIFLASQLAAWSRVLILETGHFTEDDAKQALNVLEETGKPLSNAVWCRKRAIGGTTIAWGGQSVPFYGLDFEARSWVENSGWPLKHVDLDLHSQRVNRFMNVDEKNWDTDLHGALGETDPGFRPESIHYHYSKWAPEPNFYRLKRKELAEKTTLLFNAHVTSLAVSESGLINNLVVSTVDGRSQTIAGRVFIIAAGGIESNRLLLMNPTISKAAGGPEGWLGRAFMEHPCMEVAMIKKPSRSMRRACATRFYQRRRYGIRLGAAEKFQKDKEILNVCASIIEMYPNAADDPYASAKQMVHQRSLASIIDVARHVGPLSKTAWALLRTGQMLKAGSVPMLSVMVEQEPQRGSYLSLSDRRDAFGQPLAKLNWKISRKTWETIVVYCGELTEEFRRLGLGEVALRPEVSADNEDWEACLSDVNHHMGGTRMSSTPKDGVVDPNLRVWGLQNLYVCSSSVFPTSSNSNPTLTLLSLASRLEQHLLKIKRARLSNHG